MTDTKTLYRDTTVTKEFMQDCYIRIPDIVKRGMPDMAGYLIYPWDTDCYTYTIRSVSGFQTEKGHYVQVKCQQWDAQDKAKEIIALNPHAKYINHRTGYVGDDFQRQRITLIVYFEWIN